MEIDNGNFFYTARGYSTVPNTLFEYQKKLGITNDELLFLIRINKYKTSAIIKDKNLDPTLSHRTLQRYRASLKEKGLLNFKNLVDSKEGVYIGQGIKYDLSPLWAKLQEIVDSNEVELEEQSDYLAFSSVDDCVNDEVDPFSTLKVYMDSYKEEYGTEYKVSRIEKLWYDNLPFEEKNAIAFAVSYARDHTVGKKIVPNLRLFYNCKWRMDDLVRVVKSLGLQCENDRFFKTFAEYAVDKITDFTEYSAFELRGKEVPEWFGIDIHDEHSKIEYQSALKNAVLDFTNLHEIIPAQLFQDWERYKARNGFQTVEDEFGYTIERNGERRVFDFGIHIGWSKFKPCLVDGKTALYDPNPKKEPEPLSPECIAELVKMC